MAAEEQFARLVATMLERTDGTDGSGTSKGARRALGATALKANGRLAVASDAPDGWLALASESEAVVGARR